MSLLFPASFPNGFIITFNNDLSTCENPPKCPDRGYKDEGQCTLTPPGGWGIWGIFTSFQQLVCVSHWQLDGTTSHSYAHPPHYSVMAVQWSNIELWTLNEKPPWLSPYSTFTWPLKKRTGRPQWQRDSSYKWLWLFFPHFLNGCIYIFFLFWSNKNDFKSFQDFL